MDLGVPYVQTNSYGNASEYVKTIQIRDSQSTFTDS
jgi:hypothetical protein